LTKNIKNKEFPLKIEGTIKIDKDNDDNIEKLH
jgi:hypothetical protein